MSFQTTTLWVAIVIFVVLMCLIAVMMTSAKKAQDFPPQIGQCPDYWQMTTEGCVNSHSLGNGTCDSPKDLSKATRVDKCKFAKGCALTWDGITNAEKDDGTPKYCTSGST